MQRQPVERDHRRRVLAGVVALVVFALCMGFIMDLFTGLQLAREAKSGLAWVAGLLGLGVLYLVGEMGSEWMHERDRATDALWVRACRLLALLLFVGAVLLGMLVIWRTVT